MKLAIVAADGKELLEEDLPEGPVAVLMGTREEIASVALLLGEEVVLLGSKRPPLSENS